MIAFFLESQFHSPFYLFSELKSPYFVTAHVQKAHFIIFKDILFLNGNDKDQLAAIC